MIRLFLLPMFFIASLLSAWDEELFLKMGGGVGRYIGQRDNYLETGVFYTSDKFEGFVPIVDTSFYYLNGNSWAASAGIGIRTNPCDCDRSYGANLFYDCRQFKPHNYCNCSKSGRERFFANRIGIGLESLGECFDFRFNSYLPLGKSHFKGGKHSFTTIGNGYVASYRKHEYLPYGIDGEIGYRTPLFCNFSLYGALGGYYYFKRNIEKIAGPQGRLSLWYSDFVELEGYYTYDKQNQSAFQARVMLSIPLDDLWNCFECAESCFNLLKQPIKRNGIIFTEKKCCWKYNW